ncbi:hypothetical protein [Sedimentitalea sp.]|uniref:hypothetical protein n=1 Tax=Sedimentitalea sp. TaxID=2048915 RepID=UPI00329698B4
MSYFTIPRLAFSGNFQADVSTVNNDVRHYDNATFEPRFQNPQTKTEMNGWYNPDGTGNFRLFGLQIHEALSAYGADPAQDPATGLFVNAQAERSSCKIVDLDPQMQVVSTLFGLRIVLTDGTNDYLSGLYTASAFRDMANGRAYPPSALFMSVLTDLEWGALATDSPTLMALKTAADANENKLSINLTPYAYGANQEGPMVGSIGAYATGDPNTFVAARRLVNETGPSAKVAVGDMMADIANDTLSYDFSNAINLNSQLQVVPIGEIYGAILKQGDTVTGLGTTSASVTDGAEIGAKLSGSDIKLLDQIDYKRSGFLNVSAGIADCPLDANAQALIADHPVALVEKIGSDQYQIIIRETSGGLYARADNFVNRMDPPMKGLATEDVRFKVTQWGKPIADVTIVTSLLGTDMTNQYWGSGNDGPNAPKAKYHDINTPPKKVKISSGFTSGADGWASCPISVENPGNPRVYVDGQIYTATYGIAVGNASAKAQFDLIVIHAREAQDYANPPSWDDIKPFMQQYDNLYPIMSRHLFSLADETVFREHATLLTLAFSRPLDDPNHMPATRDLSTSKRQAVLNWLAQYTGQPAPVAEVPQSNAQVAVTSVDTSNLPKPHPATSKGLEMMLANLEDGDRGKTPVMRNYLSSEIERIKKGDQA